MGHGYESMSVSEIRQLLKTKYNIDDETLKQTKKPLVALLMAYNDGVTKHAENVSKEVDEIFSNTEIDIENIEVQETQENEEDGGEEENGDNPDSLDDTSQLTFSFNDLEVEVLDDDVIIPDDFEEVEVQENVPVMENIVVEKQKISEVPHIFDEGWCSYVLSLLRDDEKFELYPKLRGLRRLTELLIGPILEKTLVCERCPNDSYNGSTIKVTVVLEVKNHKHPLYGKIIREESIADAHEQNNNISPFCHHMSSVCENRAESRCYRNLLKINVVTAEEVSGGMNEEIVNNDMISQIQIMALDLIAKRTNINVFDYINCGSSGKKYETINDISKDVALKMIEVLNKISAGEIEKPEEVGVYDPNWMK